MTEPRVPLVAPVLALLVGATFVLIGAARPSVFWDTGKVQGAREALGDGTVSVIFIAFGLVFCGVAAVAFRRRG